MPDWDTFFRGYNAGISADLDMDWSTSARLYPAQIQRQYEEWVQECEQQDRMIEQQIREAEELRKDKVRYPLFFLKEGIV